MCPLNDQLQQPRGGEEYMKFPDGFEITVTTKWKHGIPGRGSTYEVKFVYNNEHIIANSQIWQLHSKCIDFLF